MHLSVVEQFLAAVAEPERFDAGATAARLTGLLAGAQAEWPELLYPTGELVAYLAARVPSGVPAEVALDVSLGELLLAFGCARGDGKALAAMETRYIAPASGVLHRFARTPAQMADVLQVVRERLFVGPEARIRQYGGRGSLEGWLRVAMSHVAINLGVREEKHRSSTTDAMVDELSCWTDPSLALFRERYAPFFRVAFQAALETLTPEQSNFLRWTVVEGKTTDTIAAMTGLHRSSIARRIAACKKKLFEETRDALAERLPDSAHELESMMGELKSVVETSLRRFLQP